MKTLFQALMVSLLSLSLPASLPLQAKDGKEKTYLGGREAGGGDAYVCFKTKETRDTVRDRLIENEKHPEQATDPLRELELDPENENRDITSVIMLETWENQKKGLPGLGKDSDLIEAKPGQTYFELFEERLELIRKKSDFYDKLVNIIEEKIYPFSEWQSSWTGLRNIRDSAHVKPVEPKCLLMQIAHWKKVGNRFQVYFESRLMALMKDAVQMAMLPLHEILSFYVKVMKYHPNTQAARNFVFAVFEKGFEDLDEEKFQAQIEDLGLGKFGLIKAVQIQGQTAYVKGYRVSERTNKEGEVEQIEHFTLREEIDVTFSGQTLRIFGRAQKLLNGNLEKITLSEKTDINIGEKTYRASGPVSVYQSGAFQSLVSIEPVRDSMGNLINSIGFNEEGRKTFANIIDTGTLYLGIQPKGSTTYFPDQPGAIQSTEAYRGIYKRGDVQVEPRGWISFHPNQVVKEVRTGFGAFFVNGKEMSASYAHFFLDGTLKYVEDLAAPLKIKGYVRYFKPGDLLNYPNGKLRAFYQEKVDDYRDVFNIRTKKGYSCDGSNSVIQFYPSGSIHLCALAKSAWQDGIFYSADSRYLLEFDEKTGKILRRTAIKNDTPVLDLPEPPNGGDFDQKEDQQKEALLRRVLQKRTFSVTKEGAFFPEWTALQEAVKACTAHLNQLPLSLRSKYRCSNRGSDCEQIQKSPNRWTCTSRIEDL